MARRSAITAWSLKTRPARTTARRRNAASHFCAAGRRRWSRRRWSSICGGGKKAEWGISAMVESVMASDPQVDLIFSHFIPRYEATGVDPNDLRKLMRSISRWEEWCRGWSAEAARHEKLGEGGG